jgi:hypothetical protein
VVREAREGSRQVGGRREPATTEERGSGGREKGRGIGVREKDRGREGPG